MSKDFLEHKAFVELFDLHYGNLVGFVYGYVRDEEVDGKSTQSSPLNSQ
ncbi:hypothetical protein [Butyricimonas virosa]